MKNFRHRAKLKEVYSENPYALHLDSTINILIFYSLCLTTYHLIQNSILFFDAFESKLQIFIHFPLSSSVCPSLAGIQYSCDSCIDQFMENCHLNSIESFNVQTWFLSPFIYIFNFLQKYFVVFSVQALHVFC